MSTPHILAYCCSTFHWTCIIVTSTFSSLAPCARHVASTEHRRAQLNETCWKIKKLTPCHARSIQNAITVPWQQMKTRRPLWMEAPLVHPSSLLDWLAGKLHGAAMATDWSYAERGCWLPRQHGGQFVSFPLTCRKLDWLWWGLDLGQISDISFHIKRLWIEGHWYSNTSKCCVREHAFVLVSPQKSAKKAIQYASYTPN